MNLDFLLLPICANCNDLVLCHPPEAFNPRYWVKDAYKSMKDSCSWKGVYENLNIFQLGPLTAH